MAFLRLSGGSRELVAAGRDRVAVSLDGLCLGCLERRGARRECPASGWVDGTPAASPLHLPPETVLKEQYLLGRVLGIGVLILGDNGAEKVAEGRDGLNRARAPWGGGAGPPQG